MKRSILGAAFVAALVLVTVAGAAPPVVASPGAEPVLSDRDPAVRQQRTSPLSRSLRAARSTRTRRSSRARRGSDSTIVGEYQQDRWDDGGARGLVTQRQPRQRAELASRRRSGHHRVLGRRVPAGIGSVGVVRAERRPLRDLAELLRQSEPEPQRDPRVEVDRMAQSGRVLERTDRRRPRTTRTGSTRSRSRPIRRTRTTCTPRGIGSSRRAGARTRPTRASSTRGRTSRRRSSRGRRTAARAGRSRRRSSSTLRSRARSGASSACSAAAHAARRAADVRERGLEGRPVREHLRAALARPWRDLGKEARDRLAVQLHVRRCAQPGLAATHPQRRSRRLRDARLNAYMVWEDALPSEPTRGRILFSQSTDDGVTWSSPIVISHTPRRRASTRSSRRSRSTRPGRWESATTTSATTCRAESRAPISGSRRCSASCASAGSWSADTRVTPQSFDMSAAPEARGQFLGDYMGMTTNGTTFEPFFIQSAGRRSAGGADGADGRVLRDRSVATSAGGGLRPSLPRLLRRCRSARAGACRSSRRRRTSTR